jgi:type I restriction enzyme M protein
MSTHHRKNKEQRMPNDKITAVGANIAEKAAMIWNVADMLRGPFKPHEYGLVILPMTVVKRFHDCLLPTHQAVLDTYEKVKKLQVIDGFLQKASGYQFYNTSRFTFETLLADPDNIESNFRDYLSGFSANAQDVLAKFDFDNIIKRMVESNTLYLVIKEFGSEKGYLGPDKISAVDCGYIFEDLVRRFSESFGEEAGAHFTSRDIIYLMTDLLLSEADLDTSSMTVYDMAMGTSQMLSCMEERIHELNSDIEVTCFGQEFNPSTFAIAKADMMIRGGDPNNMRFGDTLSEDQFPGFTFQYIISNPPFGIDWKREQKAVEAEAARGEMGRFAPGLPKISDGQQLFVLNGLAKLANKGKMAIIQNGSPLFSGDAGSGPSNIRQYILENDWLDCIIQLSTDMFMNTGISTYIWVLSKDKPAHRAGKVQLIDASHCFEPRRKSIGTKRNDITDACRELIVTAYGEFANGKVYGDKNGIYCESKVFESVEFGYNKIVVERPQRDEAGNVILKRGKPVPDTSLRDTENVPLVQDIDAYFAREVLPYAPDAWIDHSKTKVGYEIPMTRYFYEYQAPEAVEDIVARITALEQDISAGLAELFHKEG